MSSNANPMGIHRTVFFGAPLAFLRGVAMGLCRHCVICLRVVGSSFRRLRNILGQVLDVWGHILYRLYLHKLYLPFFAWYLVTLISCYSVFLVCYSVSLFPWDRANILKLNDVAMLKNHFHL